MKKLDYHNPFTSLKHKNFRYYWIGMCVSLIGTWMQNIAQPWLAYSLTKSAFLLSLIGTLQFTPVLLFSLFAGIIIDKYSKKKILILTQSASMFITLILAFLVLTKQIQYWHILVTSTALGFVNTLDMPTRQSFVIELVGKEDLINAVALNSSVFNLARVIGPAAAGVIMGYIGMSACFFINSISFGAVIISLLFIKPIEKPKTSNRSINVITNIKDGLKYIHRKEIILNTILTVAIVGTFAMNLNVLVPVFAKELLHKQEAGFGFLMSFMGVGSFIGAMLVASLGKSGPNRFARFVLNVVPFINAIFLILTGFTRSYFLTGLLLAFTGLSFVSFSSTANSTIQINSTDEYRGRVMSVYSLVFAGSTPVGNLYAGTISQNFGSNIGFIACGGIIIVLLILLYAYRSGKKQSISSHS